MNNSLTPVLILLISLLIHIFLDFLGIQKASLIWIGRIALLTSVLTAFYFALKNRRNILAKVYGSPINFAFLRIIIFGFFTLGLPFGIGKLWLRTMNFLNLSPSLKTSLPYMDWLYPILPLGESFWLIIFIVFSASVLFSFIGLFTRASLLIYCICAFLIFILPNYFGKINHNHHLLWIPFFLIFAPGSDLFSFDQWRKKKNEIEAKQGKFWMLVIWLFIGIIYFFPGFWKLWTSGWDWALSSNLKFQQINKWAEIGRVLEPTFFDSIPYFFQASGVFVILFELFFIWLVLQSRYRSYTLLSGIVFHLACWYFLDIFFVVLLLLYVVFIDWQTVLKIKVNIYNSLESNRLDRFKKGIAMVIILLFIVAGASKTHSYPISVYPTFDRIASESLPELLIYGLKNRKRILLNKESLREDFSPERWKVLEDVLISGNEEERKEIKLLLLNHYSSMNYERIEVEIN